ncbi:MAG TPA: zinc-ribbon domain-containing protein [Blastocatellia bacterium]|nr:zinc-ribbon domain-containing protein [Blastocatellia bacterium]
MKRCHNCQAPVGDDWRFCRHCGTPLFAVGADDVPTQIIEPKPDTVADRSRPTGPAYVGPEPGVTSFPVPSPKKGRRLWIAGIVLVGLFVISLGVGAGLFWLRERPRHRPALIEPPEPPQPVESLVGDQPILKRLVDFPPDGILTVKNINGGIAITTWDEAKAQITARIEGSLSPGLVPPISIISRGRELIVETQPEKGESPEIHYEIVLPHDANLRRVVTVNGTIRIEGVRGRIDAATVNGGIELLDVGGDLSTETVNGETRVEVASGATVKQIAAKTLNGDIHITLPEPASADLVLQTMHGEIEADPSFPLTVTKIPLIGGKKAVGRIGEGNASIKIETVNGTITLSR